MSAAEPEPTPGPLGEPDLNKRSMKGPNWVDTRWKSVVIKSDWIAAILSYLEHDILPADAREARRLACRTKLNVVVGDHLYKRST